jgi:putative Ca2+/H+ antiporter (TMEM165/GDT1 family)
MHPEEGAKIHKEAEDEIDNLGKKKVKDTDEKNPDENNADNNNVDKDDSAKNMVNQLFNSVQFWKNKQPPSKASETKMQKSDSKTSLNPKASDENLAEQGNETAEEEQLPLTTKQKFFAMFKIFINTFGLIFIAEWGDRSQLATIVLASVNDVGGIILGSIVGHTICTSLAVIGGALVARWISVRVVTVIGGIVFIGFAIAQLAIGYEDPASTIDSL